MERYNFKLTEDKWQKFWVQNNSFRSKIDKNKKKVLLFRNVSLPIWENSYGSCSKLHYW